MPVIIMFIKLNSCPVRILEGNPLECNIHPEFNCFAAPQLRVANCPGMAGIVPELTHGVPCPGNVKIDHWAWICGCSLMSVLYFVLFLSVTHDLTCVCTEI